MKLKKVLAAVVLGLLSFNLVAESPEEKGLVIATEADLRAKGFEDSAATMKMVLRNKQGDESTREVRVRTLEIDGDGDKSMSIFDSPADVKGTAFLSFTHSQPVVRNPLAAVNFPSSILIQKESSSADGQLTRANR